MRKSWSEVEYKGAQFDFRGMPTEVCGSCGNSLFEVLCQFEKGVIVFYILDCKCAGCGSLLTCTTPLDFEGE